VERDNGKHTEFFINADGTYEVRADDNNTLADSFDLVKAVAKAATPFMTEPPKSNGWD